jgi:3-hydroxybutyryl-CoA dehydrogenase
MGRGIAAAALAAGYRTTIVDPNAKALQEARSAILRRLHRERSATANGQLTATSDLDEAVRTAAIVIEAVPELLELKRELFQLIDETAPTEALLVSNTSTISIGQIAERCLRPGRVIGMHFFNPVHRMPRWALVIRWGRSSSLTWSDSTRA